MSAEVARNPGNILSRNLKRNAQNDHDSHPRHVLVGLIGNRGRRLSSPRLLSELHRGALIWNGRAERVPLARDDGTLSRAEPPAVELFADLAGSRSGFRSRAAASFSPVTPISSVLRLPVDARGLFRVFQCDLTGIPPLFCCIYGG